MAYCTQPGSGHSGGGERGQIDKLTNGQACSCISSQLKKLPAVQALGCPKVTAVCVSGAGGLVGPGLLLERPEAEGGRHLCGAGAGGTGAQDCGGLGQTARGGKVVHPVPHCALGTFSLAPCAPYNCAPAPCTPSPGTRPLPWRV